jgi:hypothetical protein
VLPHFERGNGTNGIYPNLTEEGDTRWMMIEEGWLGQASQGLKNPVIDRL